MRIAHVIFRAEPTRGGAERYCDDLCRALIARGHSISLFASRFGTIAAGIEQRPIHPHGLTRTDRYGRFLSKLDAQLAAEKFDVVHAHLPIAHCDVYHTHSGFETIALDDASRGGSRSMLRTAVARIDAATNLKRRAYARVERALLTSREPPLTVCLSDRERVDAEHRFPQAVGHMTTLRPVPDDTRFPAADLLPRRAEMRRRLGLTDDHPMFLFIGQDFDRKGLSTAIRALGRMGDRRALLYVLGNGDVARFTKIAVKADAIGRVLFEGRVENVSDYLAAADAMVLPSRHEPFGMVTVEAILTGVPPIVSAIAGSSEIVEPDHTGYVIAAAQDANAWAAAMTRVIDAPTHARLSAACIASRSRFSYAAHVDAIEAIYRRVGST